jgi:hypothetical protein
MSKKEIAITAAVVIVVVAGLIFMAKAVNKIHAAQGATLVAASPFDPVWRSSNTSVTLFVERVNINGVNYLVSSKGGIIKE